MSSTLTVVPAYGRDYTSEEEIQKDFDLDKDFRIMDISSRWNGSYVNKADLVGDGKVRALKVRYAGLTKTVEIEVPAVS